MAKAEEHVVGAIGSGMALLGMAAAGAAVAYAAWVVLMFALIPVLLWLAFGTAAFVALGLATITAACTSARPCRAPLWAQRRRLAFWVGAFGLLMVVCAEIAHRHPQTILFWPH